MHCLLLLFFGFWLRSRLVDGIFVEDAFETDWHLMNVGTYKCVLENFNQDLLIILSEIDSKSLVSFVNETDGQLLYRQLLERHASDAMMVPEGGYYLIKDDEGKLFAFDASSGLPVKHETSNLQFTSSCSPDLSGIEINQNSLRVLDSETKLELFHADLPSNFESVVFLYTDYVSNLRVLVSTTDDEVLYQSLENGAIENQWSRDESVSNIVSHTFINVVDDGIEAISEELSIESSYGNPMEAYLFRVGKNWRRLTDMFRESGYSVGKVLTRLLKLHNENLSSTQDVMFGIAKILVIATDRGIIEGLDMQNGKKVWRFDSGLNKIILLEWYPDSRELLLFAGDGSFAIYNVTNAGQPILYKKEQLQNGGIKSMSPLSSYRYFVTFESGEQKVIAIESDNSTAPRKTFITDHDTNGVYGHVVAQDGQLQDTWRINLKDSEKIVAFASKKEEPVVTLGHTLGNRTVLYKYLYPNLASFVTFNIQTGLIYVNLIDTVTGEMLYTQYHDDKVDIDQPINMVFGENWFIYSYFSAEPIPEQKLVTVELYESLEANKRVSSLFTESNPLKESHKPEVLSKSYFFPEVISKMTISKTKFGITSKAIILELQNGQITYLSKELLSARRIEESKMTDDDKREFMAMPYMSTIPLNDYFVITHSRNLVMGQNSQLVSVATNLESTSIVCDIGHDIFCSKIYPSGQFDIMSPSFEKGKLIATIAGLIVLCYFLRPSVEAAKLKKLWCVK